jgi:BolA family transcriptional regulator, general stress-responsive regulator
MQTQQRLTELLTDGFAPTRLDIANDSHKHGNAPDIGSHFSVLMVSERFAGLNRVKRHQVAYACVAELLRNPIHALALHLYAPGEIDAQAPAPEGPACGGGDGRVAT